MTEWIENFEKFLTNDLESAINESMLFANPKPHILLVQRPNYCDRDNNIAHSRALIEIAGVQYPVKITADYKLDLIFVVSEVFEITIAYDFYRGRIEEIESGISENYIRDPHIRLEAK